MYRLVIIFIGICLIPLIGLSVILTIPYWIVTGEDLVGILFNWTFNTIDILRRKCE